MLSFFCIESRPLTFTFLALQSEKDTRSLIKFLLLGYDIVYLEKDSKYSHALRISHPGCETHMFYADSKEAAEEWLEVRKQ